MKLVLDDLKTLLGIEVTNTSKDSILNLHIRKAVTSIKNYLQTEDDVQNLYPDAVIELAVFFYLNNVNVNIKEETQGNRAIVYQDNLNLISTKVKALLPIPLIKIMG
jgi:hypothetical protein